MSKMRCVVNIAKHLRLAAARGQVQSSGKKWYLVVWGAQIKSGGEVGAGGGGWKMVFLDKNITC